MDKGYLHACEDDIIKNKEDCCICYKPGRHEGCSEKFIQEQIEVEKQMQEAKLQEAESDKVFLKKYSTTGSYLESAKNNKEYLKYKAYLESKIDMKGHGYYQENAFENDQWWYIPYGFIGCVGYIVEKQSKNIYCLGSGYGMRHIKELGGAKLLWGGILAYLNGEVEVEPITNA